MTLVEVFAREEQPMSTIRAAVLAALDRPGAPSQASLARTCGIAPENLNKWLRGQRPTIPLATAERLLAALGLKIVLDDTNPGA